MKYETTTEKGSEITATLFNDHITVVVWNGWDVYAEWFWDINRAAHRFQWLIEHV